MPKFNKLFYTTVIAGYTVRAIVRIVKLYSKLINKTTTIRICLS